MKPQLVIQLQAVQFLKKMTTIYNPATWRNSISDYVPVIIVQNRLISNLLYVSVFSARLNKLPRKKEASSLQKHGISLLMK